MNYLRFREMPAGAWPLKLEGLQFQHIEVHFKLFTDILWYFYIFLIIFIKGSFEDASELRTVEKRCRLESEIKEMWCPLESEIKEMWCRLVSESKEMWCRLVSEIKEMWSRLVSEIKEMWCRLVSEIKEMWCRLESEIKEMWCRLESEIKEMWCPLESEIKEMWCRLVSESKEVWCRLVSAIKEMWCRLESERECKVDVAELQCVLPQKRCGWKSDFYNRNGCGRTRTRIGETAGAGYVRVCSCYARSSPRCNGCLEGVVEEASVLRSLIGESHWR